MEGEILPPSENVATALGNPTAVRLMPTDVTNSNVGVVDISTSVLR